MRLPAIILASVLILFATKVTGEDTWENALALQARRRIASNIKALDQQVQLRWKEVKELVEDGRSANADLTIELLLRALPRGNHQLKEGIIEVLTQIGDPRGIPPIDYELRFDIYPDLRMWSMKTLPVFLLPADRALQNEFLKQAENQSYSLTDRMVEVLHRPPMRTSNNEFDSSLEQRRRNVIRAIASQLNPVGTAIQGFGTKRSDERARQALSYFAGSQIRHNHQKWIERWKTAGVNFLLPRQDEISMLQVTACMVLADIGAPATPEILEGLKRLLQKKEPALREASLNCLSAMCDVAASNMVKHQQRLALLGQNREHEAETTWRRRQMEMTATLLPLARSLGLEGLTAKEEAVRIAAFDCIGASREPSLPDNTPVQIAARRERTIKTIKELRTILLQGGEHPRTQIHLAQALGKLGERESVQLLHLITNYRSFSNGIRAEREKRDEHNLVRSAIAAVAAIAARPGDPGREKAREELLKQLTNTRELSGGPGEPGGVPARVQNLALEQLQKMVNKKLRSFSPEDWQDRLDEFDRQAELQ